MAFRISVTGCLFVALCVSTAQGGAFDVPPLGQLTYPAGGPIREYPEQVISRLNGLNRGPIRFNPQDALQNNVRYWAGVDWSGQPAPQALSAPRKIPSPAPLPVHQERKEREH